MTYGSFVRNVAILRETNRRQKLRPSEYFVRKSLQIHKWHATPVDTTTLSMNNHESWHDERMTRKQLSLRSLSRTEAYTNFKQWREAYEKYGCMMEYGGKWNSLCWLQQAFTWGISVKTKPRVGLKRRYGYDECCYSRVFIRTKACNTCQHGYLHSKLHQGSLKSISMGEGDPWLGWCSKIWLIYSVRCSSSMTDLFNEFCRWNIAQLWKGFLQICISF